MTYFDHVAGWSRFEFKLKPQEETQFSVVEDVVYASSIQGKDALTNFLKKIAPGLVDEKIMKEELVREARNLIHNEELKTALSKIQSDSYTDRYIQVKNYDFLYFNFF
jgi:hypothetical protein